VNGERSNLRKINYYERRKKKEERRMKKEERRKKKEDRKRRRTRTCNIQVRYHSA
jgi:hypothetical protein